MNEAKILVTGESGQLGKALRKYLPSAVYKSKTELDLSDKQSITNFDFSDFEVIINTAAYTNVDGAEVNEELAFSINAEGPKLLATISKNLGITLVHISSDYVFDGSQEIHPESEQFSPISIYGKSKAAGDEAIINISPNFYILRTSWVVGDGNNFVQTMLRLGTQHSELSIVSDQIGRLTFADDLAKAIKHLLEKQPEFGTYNATNSGPPASWAEVAREIFRISEMNVEVVNTTTDEFAKGKSPFAPRPRFSTLDTDKLEATGFVFPEWREALTEYIKQEKS